MRQAIGTAAGAAGALALAPGRIKLLVLIFVSDAIGFTLRSVSTDYWIMFGPPMTMLLIDSIAELDAGLLRIALTLAGALPALVFARLLFRTRTQQRIDDRLARLLRARRPRAGDRRASRCAAMPPSAQRTGPRPPRRRTWTGQRLGSDHREKSAPACPRPAGPPSAYATT